MLKAEEVKEMASVENCPVKVSRRCDRALDNAILQAIEKWKAKVEVALWYKDCPEEDDTVEAYLKQHWYKDIEVTHDYPWYSESYEGKTFIKFTY